MPLPLRRSLSVLEVIDCAVSIAFANRFVFGLFSVGYIVTALFLSDFALHYSGGAYVDVGGVINSVFFFIFLCATTLYATGCLFNDDNNQRTVQSFIKQLLEVFLRFCLSACLLFLVVGNVFALLAYAAVHPVILLLLFLFAVPLLRLIGILVQSMVMSVGFPGTYLEMLSYASKLMRHDGNPLTLFQSAPFRLFLMFVILLAPYVLFRILCEAAGGFDSKHAHIFDMLFWCGTLVVLTSANVVAFLSNMIEHDAYDVAEFLNDRQEEEEEDERSHSE